jgi:hypothetical protein
MKFLTFLNQGCLDICKNMLISAEKVGIDKDDFYIACLDKISYNSLSNYPNAFMWIGVDYINENLSEYQDWTFQSNSGFRNIVKYKWRIIQEVYRQHKELCWVDTDIVFKENPTEYVKEQEEVLFQSDSPGSTLCSGFMVFNKSVECESMINECALEEEEDDQLLINKIALDKYYDNVALLNEDLFPNGHVYYQQDRKENAVIVHNNWMVGIEAKIQHFKDENLWYL